MSTQEGLPNIVNRLEAVVARLEDLEGIAHKNVAGKQITEPPVMNTPAKELDKDLVRFNTILTWSFQNFLDATEALVNPREEPPEVLPEVPPKPLYEVPPEVLEILNNMVLDFKKVLDLLRDYLFKMAKYKEPDSDTLEELRKPLRQELACLDKTYDSYKLDEHAKMIWGNHIMALKGAVLCVSWISYGQNPADHLDNVIDQTQYWTTKLITNKSITNKSLTSNNRKWVEKLLEIIVKMKDYVTQYHQDAVVWNAEGVEYGSITQPTSRATPSAAPANSNAAAVFSELNRGGQVTRGLRKVDKSEMTHKNPALRSGGVVPATVGATTHEPAHSRGPTSNPPKFDWEGSKFMIEYQENQPCLEVSIKSNKEIVNIHGCKNTTILIHGKANAVTMTDCKQTSVRVQSLISSVEITGSTGFKLELTGFVPTIQLNSTDSGQIYLSKDSLDVEILTTKCVGISVNLSVGGEEAGLYREQAIMETLKTAIKDGKLSTTVVKHAG